MAYTEFYCDPVSGDDLNAGSSEGAPLVSLTAGDWDTDTRVFTKTGANLSGVTVDMWASVFLDAASAPTGYIARITAVNDTADTITLSDTDYAGTKPGSSTGGMSLRVGGALLGPVGASAFPISSFFTNALQNAANDYGRLNLKNNATYAITAGIVQSANNDGPFVIAGYTTTPGDGGKAVFDGGGGVFTILDFGGDKLKIENIIAQNCAGSDSCGVRSQGLHCSLRGIGVKSVGSYGIRIDGGLSILSEFEVTNHNLSNYADGWGVYAIGAGVTILNGIVHDAAYNGANGVFGGIGGSISWVLVSDVSGAGIGAVSGGCVVQQCDVYGCGTGIQVWPWDTDRPTLIRNCNSVANTGYGYYFATINHGRLEKCGSAGNGLGRSNTLPTGWEDVDPITYDDATNGPWTDPAAGDFTLSDMEAQYSGRAVFPMDLFVTPPTFASRPDIGSQIRYPTGVAIDPVTALPLFAIFSKRWMFMP